MNRHFVAILLLCALLSGPLSAGEAPAGNRVALSVSAVAEVENDTLVARLYVEKTGKIPGRLAEQVNRDIGWAVARAKQTPGVRVQTLDYQTRPNYRKQSREGWRVRQSLRLTSRDVLALSQLIGELQQRLLVEQVRYEISRERRDEVERRLVARAIAAFKARAELIRTEWGAAAYRLLQMDIGASGRPPVFRERAMMMADAPGAPTFEAGRQRLQITASGAIELRDK